VSNSGSGNQAFPFLCVGLQPEGRVHSEPGIVTLQLSVKDLTVNTYSIFGCLVRTFCRLDGTCKAIIVLILSLKTPRLKDLTAFVASTRCIGLKLTSDLPFCIDCEFTKSSTLIVLVCHQDGHRPPPRARRRPRSIIRVVNSD
jgi:hypothetical protein